MGLTSGQLALNAGILKAGLEAGGGIAGFMQSRTNAKILEKRGKQAEEQLTREGKQRAGAQKARFAKGGVDLKGTPDEVSKQTMEQARIAALRARFAFDGEANFQRQRGNIAALAGSLGAASTLLGATSREKQLDEGIKVVRSSGDVIVDPADPRKGGSAVNRGFDVLFDRSGRPIA